MKITKYSDYLKGIKRFMKDNNIKQKHLEDEYLTPTKLGRYFKKFAYNPEPTLMTHYKIVQKLCAISRKRVPFEHDIFATASDNE